MTRGHLLIVDDEPSILSTLQRALSLEGYAVDVAGGYRVASEKTKKRAYDLHLFDVSLPDGDGLTLLAELRAAKVETPVIMMSGHATIETAVRATKLGALSFLEKPLNTDALLLAVEQALRLDRAETEAKTLRNQVFGTELLGQSPPMLRLLDQIARAAKSQASVLITGERGTGKELVARAIHTLSPRARGPLEKLNCAALPSELIESELFGHEAGAFTGATKQRRGKFERASGGTLFLDEVGDMPLGMQAKLLRVLQEKEVERVGGSEVVRIDTRVVAATNRDLKAAMDKDLFRADLYDRLHVIPLEIPPLRQRREDIPLLARNFTAQSAQANDRRDLKLADDAVVVLSQYDYPGNVRELRNIIERLVILADSDVVDAASVRANLPATTGQAGAHGFRPNTPFRELVEEAERSIITAAIAHHQGHMAKAARSLELERSHLYKKARSLGLRTQREEDEG
jgi:DNA-binding NtrC family response regulator